MIQIMPICVELLNNEEYLVALKKVADSFIKLNEANKEFAESSTALSKVELSLKIKKHD